jgi:hypothetical protein
LHNQSRAKIRLENLNNVDAWSDHEFDIPLKLYGDNHQEPLNPPIDPYLSKDLDEFPFAQEDDISDVVRPKGKDYQEQLNKYKDKDLGSITILKRGNEKKSHVSKDDPKNIALIASPPPTWKQGKDTQDGEEVVGSKVREKYFQQETQISMWNKKKSCFLPYFSLVAIISVLASCCHS